MLETKIYNPETHISPEEKAETISFLFDHLEQYGDKKEDITKAINFSLKEDDTAPELIPIGGFVLNGYMDNKIVGSVVVNKTGMSGYIPENILVYIATHRDYRGKGIGRQLMEKAFETAEGNVALHVEPDNPARFLYEKVGMTSKYIEMRYIRK
ncbi:MAG: GNAT family N-acetyltransferase [Bacteroidales bacterium]|jgi:ribosomal protein S18 acetylase RimI-like enzyme|nr:GNAT family N-acetyltransferase [Bacteroidales bacterium]